MEFNNQMAKILISQQQIAERTKVLAKQITADYVGKRPLVVGILKGGWIFLADLAREIDMDVDIDFMAVASYGGGTTTSGEIVIKKDLTMDCKDRDVLIVEDIVDSGITLSNLKAVLLSRKAKSVTICTLLSKPSRRRVNVDVKYIGFEIPDEFVVGCGMDYDEKFRTLKDICIMKNQE